MDEQPNQFMYKYCDDWSIEHGYCGIYAINGAELLNEGSHYVLKFTTNPTETVDKIEWYFNVYHSGNIIGTYSYSETEDTATFNGYKITYINSASGSTIVGGTSTHHFETGTMSISKNATYEISIETEDYIGYYKGVL